MTVGRAPVATFVLTAGLLSAVQAVIPRPMLMAERFLPGAGWAELLLLSLWAAWLAYRLADPRSNARWRRIAWTLFSIVFFAQLALGLAGLERFLMTGTLHLPVPAMIVGGPAYRGSGFFMPILFVSTVLFVGPAWCSWLCYLGSWDLAAAGSKARPNPLPRWTGRFRAAMLVVVAGTAGALGWLEVPPAAAAAAGIGFGVVGVAIMRVASRRTGQSAHCLAWCPIGFLAGALGRLSPFRMRIAGGCDGCGVCTLACRYDALGKDDLERRKVGFSCTLCGDCVSRCRAGLLAFRLPGLSPAGARSVFLVLAVSLHALFLGVARI